MLHVPSWLTLGIAILVIAFGLYRISLALKKKDPEAGKGSMMGGGFYKMNPRTHIFIGAIYLALGGALIATSFGWNPFGSGAKTEPAPAKKVPGGIELEKKN